LNPGRKIKYASGVLAAAHEAVSLEEDLLLFLCSAKRGKTLSLEQGNLSQHSHKAGVLR